jgi:hypothetical protein
MILPMSILWLRAKEWTGCGSARERRFAYILQRRLEKEHGITEEHGLRGLARALHIRKMTSKTRQWSSRTAVRRAMKDGAHSAPARKKITNSTVIEVVEEAPQTRLDGHVTIVNVPNISSIAMCSNCNQRPVASITKCFDDWCLVCDESLWTTRPSSVISSSIIAPSMCHNCKQRPVASITKCFDDWCLVCDESLWATSPSSVISSSILAPSNAEVQHHSLLHISTDYSPWDSFSFWQKAKITTVGIPITKMNAHPLGLAQIIFDNCVVKVRAGHNLDNLVSLGRLGNVQLSNVTSNGWIATDRALLPCCIFARWMSGMKASRTCEQSPSSCDDSDE